MDRRGSVAVLAAAVLGAVAATPAFAVSAQHKRAPVKGSWHFVDVTPDPSASVASYTDGADSYCRGGSVPAAPVDKNSFKLTVHGPGTLKIRGDNTLDWAMEVDDSKRVPLGSSDGGLPLDEEGIRTTLKAAGTYTVVFCNLGGGPTASATYTFKYS